MKRLSLITVTSPAQIFGAPLEALQEAIRGDPEVTYSISRFGEIDQVDIYLVCDLSREVVVADVFYGRERKCRRFLFFLHVNNGKVCLVGCDEENVRRCSNDPEISGTVQHWS